MNPPAPAYLTPFVLVGTFTAAAAVLFGLPRALERAGWIARQRRRASITASLLLIAWLCVALVTARLGFYHGASSQIPAIQYGILLPITLGMVLFWRSSPFRRVIQALPQAWIVGLQLYRTEGVIFLILYAGGHLPGVFAWPAGVGDILVGLLAPIVAARLTRNSTHSTGWLRAWNLFGIADLIVAVTTGFLSSPSRFQIFALGAPNTLITAFPLVMIPIFLVPLAILLHLASLKKISMGGQV
jgi:hypothetical protein